MAVYRAVYGLVSCINPHMSRRFLGHPVILVISCACNPAADQAGPRQAAGAYRAGIDQGGVSPLRTAQNKKGGSAQPPPTQPDQSGER